MPQQPSHEKNTSIGTRSVSAIVSGMLAVTMIGAAPVSALADEAVVSQAADDVASAIESLPSPSSLDASCFQDVIDVEESYLALTSNQQDSINPKLRNKLAACYDVVISVTTPKEETAPAKQDKSPKAAVSDTPVPTQTQDEPAAPVPSANDKENAADEGTQDEVSITKPSIPDSKKEEVPAVPSKGEDQQEKNGTATDTRKPGESGQDIVSGKTEETKEDGKEKTVPGATSSDAKDPVKDGNAQEAKKKTQIPGDASKKTAPISGAGNASGKFRDEDATLKRKAAGNDASGKGTALKAIESNAKDQLPVKSSEILGRENKADDDGKPRSEKDVSDKKKVSKDQDSADSGKETSVQDDGYQSDYPEQSYVQPHYTRNFSTESFIASIGESARIIGQEKGLYASIMIAQAVLESASGNSGLAQSPNNNLFGIKGSYKGNSVNMYTNEDNGAGSLYGIYSDFRRYQTALESMEDYADLLKDNPELYSKAWKKNAKDYKEAARALQGVYATSTVYASSLIGLIDTYDLTRFDAPYKWRIDERVKDVSGNSLSKNTRKLTMMDYARLQAYAVSLIGTPYVWGGTTTDGFDCSGLVQHIYSRVLGKKLPRTTFSQQYEGTEVKFEDLRMGDLLFFDNEAGDGGAEHVAMYLSDGYYLHAPQPGDVVRIGSFDTFKPSFAKRVISMVDIDEQGYPAHTATRVKAAFSSFSSWLDLFVARREETETSSASMYGIPNGSRKAASMVFAKPETKMTRISSSHPASFMTVKDAIEIVYKD